MAALKKKGGQGNLTLGGRRHLIGACQVVVAARAVSALQGVAGSAGWHLPPLPQIRRPPFCCDHPDWAPPKALAARRQERTWRRIQPATS